MVLLHRYPPSPRSVPGEVSCYLYASEARTIIVRAFVIECGRLAVKVMSGGGVDCGHG